MYKKGLSKQTVKNCFATIKTSLNDATKKRLLPFYPLADLINIKLKDGDMYIMSEKAVGTDWKRRNIYTLRHSAGGPKYTKPKLY